MLFPALFAMIVGFGMIAQWAMLYFSKQIPELKSEPIRIAFHIAAELLTAILLLIAGIGLLLNLNISRPLFLTAVGMLFYTAIVSPGYFAQKGKWHWVGIFAVVILLGIIAILMVI